MPSHVRIFWWLTVSVTFLTTFSLAWSYTFPPAHYLATLAKLPPDMRKDVHRFNIEFAMVVTGVVNGTALILAWVASFRRQNWARWAFTIGYVFIFTEPLVYDAVHHRFDWSSEFPLANWLDIAHYWVMALWVAAIVFVFTGNAREWFNSRAIVRTAET